MLPLLCTKLTVILNHLIVTVEAVMVAEVEETAEEEEEEGKTIRHFTSLQTYLA